MSTIDLAPGSPEWRATITPSKIPAILGMSRWQSQFALWHEMAGLVEPDPITAEKQKVFDAGHAFEAALDALWRVENPGWRTSGAEVQVHGQGLPFETVATLDRQATVGKRTVGPTTTRVLEFKTSRDLSEWGDDFTDEAPQDYLLQVQWQMHVTGYTKWPAHLMVMGPFFQWHTYEIAYNAAVCEVIEQRCIAWMDSLATGVRPDLDDSVATYECVKRQHPDIDPDSTAEISPALATDFLSADREMKELAKRHRGLKSQLLDVMGSARLAECQGIAIASRRPARHGVSLYPAKTDPSQIGVAA